MHARTGLVVNHCFAAIITLVHAIHTSNAHRPVPFEFLLLLLLYFYPRCWLCLAMLGGFKLFWISGQCRGRTPVGISSGSHAINRVKKKCFSEMLLTYRFARTQHAVVLCTAASLHRYVHCTCTARGQPGYRVSGYHMGPCAAYAMCRNCIERQRVAAPIRLSGARQESTG